jgi:hypothetical protein
MGYPDPDDFEGFEGDCKNRELVEDLRDVLKDHGYGGQFALVTTEQSGSMEIHAPMKPELFMIAANAMADAALQIE